MNSRGLQGIIPVAISIFVILAVVVQFRMYQRTRLRSALYLGSAGLVALALVVVEYLRILHQAKYLLDGAAILLLGWGFARSMTVDHERWLILRRDISFLPFILGTYPNKDLSGIETTLPKGLTVVGCAAGFICAGLLTKLFWPSRVMTAVIFVVFGVQLLTAFIVFRRRRTAEH